MISASLLSPAVVKVLQDLAYLKAESEINNTWGSSDISSAFRDHLISERAEQKFREYTGADS